MNSKDFDEATETKIQGYIKNGVDKTAISKAKGLTFHQCLKSAGSPKLTEPKVQTVWWRVPYHPIMYASNLRRRVEATMNKWKDHIKDPKMIRIAWYNESQPHMNEVRRIKKKEG